ncbi:hypothetical protein TH606_03170 [Thermodesulfatator autotrophicus]|uniref:Uncharacterized protein n=1 Tax=Thermodesulfatator autotrophicus TaxID=1795632 RepID=A0A177E877_9BACT|nr:hypothetical protein TH606_03170 [Thermodesulfatator autotrophicus]
MIAKDMDSGKVLHQEKRNYFEIGLDLDGFMRYGAWQIKEIIDLTLQPLKTQHERFFFTLDKGVNKAEIEVNVYYYISGKKGDLIHQAKKVIVFPELE